MTDVSELDFQKQQVRIHPRLLDIISRDFRDHRNGLPEWAKNSYHGYLERSVDSNARIIVFIFGDAQRLEGREPKIACLDFGGMDIPQLRSFAHWGDPMASGRSLGETHGNGGKAYMVGGFSGKSYIVTVKDGKRNIFGFQPGNPSPGHFGPSDVRVGDVKRELDLWLSRTGGSVDRLPAQAKMALDIRQAFTLVVGEAPKEIVNRGKIRYRPLVDGLSTHAQMLAVLKSNSVFVTHGGQIANSGKALSAPQIDLRPGTTVREIEIPKTFVSEAGVEIPTVREGEPAGILRLSIADTSIPRRPSVSALHRIDYIANNAHRGFEPIRGLVGAAHWTDQIFGECHLDMLDPEYVSNTRAGLTDAPLTRELQSWIQDRIHELASEFERTERHEIAEEDKAELSAQVHKLDVWKNQFLDRLRLGPGAEPGDDPPPPHPRNRLPVGEIDRIRIAADTARAGIGVPVAFSLQFFDASGKRVRPVPVTWMVSDNTLVTLNEDERQMVTRSPGHTTVFVQTEAHVRSNTVSLEIVAISEIHMPVDQVTISIGERKRITPIVKTTDGREMNDVRLYWLSADEDIVTVGLQGYVFGVDVGDTVVHAMDDSLAEATVSVTVEAAGASGEGYPTILISEINTAPYDEDPPALDPEEGPVHQRTRDVSQEIWWINLASPVARYLYEKEGIRSPAWLGYLLSCTADILARIIVQEKFDSNQVTPDSWQFEYNNVLADAQSALDSDIGGYFEDGELPLTAN